MCREGQQAETVPNTIAAPPPGVSLAYQQPDSPRDWRVPTPKSPYMHRTSEMQAERPKSDSVRPVNDLLKQDNRDRFSTVNTVPLAPFPDQGLRTTFPWVFWGFHGKYN